MKSILIILDGWGLATKSQGNAVEMAATPVMDQLYKTALHSVLLTHGENVGLPQGQMGNSEVGHLNIGAGRIVYQDLAKINMAIAEGKLDESGKIKKMVEKVKKENGHIHLIGLCSDGGVHSHISHLEGIVDYMDQICDHSYFIHAITDGRDTDPKSALKTLTEFNRNTENSKSVIATVTGRYFAMDRDKRWERTKIAYDALVHRKGEEIDSIQDWLERNYEEGITDEFLKPAITKEGEKKGFRGIAEGDMVFFFNFRTDRPRQLCTALNQRYFRDPEMKKLNLNFLTMTRYDEGFKGIEVLFEKENLYNTLGEVLSKHGKTQLRMAETEKYPHVTFFFSGGREAPFYGEERLLIPSPKVPTYDLQPEMSAREVTKSLLERLSKSPSPDFICLNYANPDMVGHTGNLEAAVIAVETVDECLGKLLPKLRELNYEILIIADHGNSEYIRNDDDSPNTAHTINPVPCVYEGKIASDKQLSNGILADVAPSLLFLMGVEQPPEMTGKNLFQ